MVEHYPDTVKVDSSSLSVATKKQWLVAQLVRCTRLLTGGCEFESHRANERNIEQTNKEYRMKKFRLPRFHYSKFLVHLFYILRECDEDGESWRSVKPLPSGLRWFESIHSHMERDRLVEGAVLKTVCS